MDSTILTPMNSSPNTAATSTPSSDPGGADTTTFPVTVTLDDPAAVANLSGTDVSVVVTRQRHDDVTAVPVTALLALAEGGYAVERASDHRLVPVELGLFDDGWVEVSGVDAGLRVVVPA